MYFNFNCILNFKFSYFIVDVNKQNFYSILLKKNIRRFVDLYNTEYKIIIN